MGHGLNVNNVNGYGIKMSKYMTFDLIGHSDSKKTKVYAVNSKSGKDWLGVIKWYAPWRQYCFLPDPGCVFSRGCLKDVEDFIEKLMEERKK